jgi:hypothetical protein
LNSLAAGAWTEGADLTFAQFVMLTPFPGAVDFNRWERAFGSDVPQVAGVPITRRWLIPHSLRPKLYCPHPLMSAEEIRERTQAAWDRYYSLRFIWKRSHFLKAVKSRLAFLLISKIYRQMYADTGIASDSARIAWSARWHVGWPSLASACLPAVPCRTCKYHVATLATCRICQLAKVNAERSSGGLMASQALLISPGFLLL